MKIFKTYGLVFLFCLCGLSECRLKAYQRSGRSYLNQQNQSQELPNYDEINKCTAFGYFGVSPFSLISPDDRETLSLTESSMKFERNSSSKPVPFLKHLQFPYSLTLCVAGNKRLEVVENEDGSFSLGAVPAEKWNLFLNWQPMSVRESPVTGNYIVDMAVYQKLENQCCFVSLVDYNLKVLSEDCAESCDKVPAKKLLTFHGIKFLYFFDSQWYGLFILCGDPDCKERVVNVKINDDVFALEPAVLVTATEPQK